MRHTHVDSPGAPHPTPLSPSALAQSSTNGEKGENGVVSAACGTGVAPAAAHEQDAPSAAVVAAREENAVPATVLEAEDSVPQCTSAFQ